MDGVKGGKNAKFCAEYTEYGMIDVNSKECGHERCTKGRSYGVEGSKKAEFCIRHRNGCMIIRKRGGHQGCTEQPSYGAVGKKKMNPCIQQRIGMIAPFIEEGAAKKGARSSHFTFGVAGSKSVEFCAQHTKGGMVDVHSKRCGPTKGTPRGRRTVYPGAKRSSSVVSMRRTGCSTFAKKGGANTKAERGRQWKKTRVLWPACQTGYAEFKIAPSVHRDWVQQATRMLRCRCGCRHAPL